MYCSYCGKRMIEIKTFEFYSKATGQKIYRIKYKCPDRKGFFNNHDYEIFDDVGEPYYEEL